VYPLSSYSVSPSITDRVECRELCCALALFTMDKEEVLKWLLDGDVSIQYQVHRDLLSSDRKDLRTKIESQGWGAKFLSNRRPEGHWGQKFYQPKWTSSHYTLLDLKNLCINPDHPLIQESVDMIVANEKAPDGGIKPTDIHFISVIKSVDLPEVLILSRATYLVFSTNCILIVNLQLSNFISFLARFPFSIWYSICLVNGSGICTVASC